MSARTLHEQGRAQLIFSCMTSRPVFIHVCSLLSLPRHGALAAAVPLTSSCTLSLPATGWLRCLTKTGETPAGCSSWRSATGMAPVLHPYTTNNGRSPRPLAPCTATITHHDPQASSACSGPADTSQPFPFLSPSASIDSRSFLRVAKRSEQNPPFAPAARPPRGAYCDPTFAALCIFLNAVREPRYLWPPNLLVVAI